MLGNFLLISVRSILKSKGGAYLNLLGLALGMAACLYIFTYIQFELFYDRFSDNRDVYRVETHTHQVDLLISSNAFTSLNAIGKVSERSGSEAGTRLIPFSEEGSALFLLTQPNGNDLKIHIETVYYAEPSIFDVFPIEVIAGIKSSLLGAPNTILLSASTAQKIFRDDLDAGRSIVGKEFKPAGTGTFSDTYIITGIFQDLPSNTHLKYDALVSISSPGSGMANMEFQYAEKAYTYVLNPRQSNVMVPVGTHSEDGTRQKSLFLRPVSDIHLAEEISNEPAAGASQSLLLFLAVIGLIILFLACTNYINSTIVNSIYRAKEIGIRKVLGARPGQLIRTFIGEALLINILATLLSWLLFRIGMQLTLVWTDIGYPGSNEVSFQAQIYFSILLLFISTLLSGLYPAIYLSKLNPIASLRSKINMMETNQVGGAGSIIRTLLVFQLSASIIFLTSVYIVHSQLKYLEEHDTESFDFEIKGIFPGSSQASTNFTNLALSFLEEMKGHDLIEEVRFTNLNNGLVRTAQVVELLHEKDPHFDSLKNSFNFYVIDHSYWKENSESFLNGSNFSSAFGRDPDNLIVNLSAVEALGYQKTDSLIGKSILTRGGNRKVIGVVKNKTPNEPPTVYATGFRYLTYLDFVLDYPGKAGESLDSYIKKVEHLISTRLPFLYLLDREYQAQRNVEQGMLKLFTLFSFLAIAISCMGLLGLSFFITQKRTMEIGIRKILGAPSRNILGILLYDFLKLIIYAALFSLPIVIYGGSIWLENYPYRISIDLTVIGLPILTIILICVIVVGKKCWDASMISPIHSLRAS